MPNAWAVSINTYELAHVWARESVNGPHPGTCEYVYSPLLLSQACAPGRFNGVCEASCGRR